MKPYQSTLPGPKGLPAELERFFWKMLKKVYRLLYSPWHQLIVGSLPNVNFVDNVAVVMNLEYWGNDDQILIRCFFNAFGLS